MIEIAIKIKHYEDNRLAVAVVPTVTGEDQVERLYAHVLHEIIQEAVVPAIADFTERVGAKAQTHTGSKAMFIADQAGLLPDVPEQDGKN